MRKVMILVLFIVFALSACGKPSYLNTSNYYHPTLKDDDVDHPLGWKRYYFDMMQCQSYSRIGDAFDNIRFNDKVKFCMESRGYAYKHD